ncbi:MAG: tetratricopeptide repeat protein [Treponema sp.]|nr:tetratricopeptide repeat protein [Candidatus Treponema scatequi]
MKSKKSLFCILILGALISANAFSQVAEFDADSVDVNYAATYEASETLSDALNAYKTGDWKTSIFLFKKLHSNPSNITPETLYMLIMAETYSGNYKQAAASCDIFIKNFPHNQYVELVTYQKGKNLYHVNDYEKSIITLSDFCHSHTTHPLYAASLFWIAESFYASYNFDSAKPLYERIVTEYPDDSKAKDAKYRLDVIAQRSREEKLLYLLKQTGEDYLSSRESYEKTLKQYNVENSVGVNNQIRELRSQKESLDSDLAEQKKRTAELEAQLKSYEKDLSGSIRELKSQAAEALELIEEEE